LLRSLSKWRDELEAEPFRNADGNAIPLSCVLIDSGYSPDAAYEFVRRHSSPFRVAKGSSNFHPGQPSSTRRVGRHFFGQLQAGGVWLYMHDSDHWKRAVHQRFLADPLDENNRPNPGSLTLFVPQGSRTHKTFSAHVLAEEFVSEFVPGKGERSYWLKHSANNHYFDAAALCLCAAEMAGCGVFARPKPKAVSLLQLAQNARAKR